MQKSKQYLMVAFVVILTAVVVVSVTGIILLGQRPIVLQGEIESTQILISGKLPGRIDTLLVTQGQSVKRGDTLVVINSPEAEAKHQQVSAMESVAAYQNEKIDDGTRVQIIESLKQLWNKSKSDLSLATITLRRIENLYRDSVVTSQRKDEVVALYNTAVVAEKVAHQEYQMALIGAQKEDKQSARSLVWAAQAVVNQVDALLNDSHLMAPQSGEIATIYPHRGELVGAGAPIMTLVVPDDAHAVLNVREDLMSHFAMGGVFMADVPALNKKNIAFKINYISPLGSYATWRSTKQSGSYDMRTFEIHALPKDSIDGLRPGMSVLITLNKR